MPKAQLIFTTIIQDSQEFGSNNEHMVSRIFFDLRVGGDLHNGLAADVKQTVGADYENDPLEVSLPHSLAGSVIFEDFRKHVEQYYRESFGSSESAFRLGPATKVRMMHNVVNRRSVAEIEFLDSQRKAGW
jgi:hypothetical protein